MIASVDVTIGSHIFSHIERIAQFRLVNDLDPPALSCYDRYHVRIFFVYLALPDSRSYAPAAFSKWNKSSIIIYDLGVAFVALKQGVERTGMFLMICQPAIRYTKAGITEKKEVFSTWVKYAFAHSWQPSGMAADQAQKREQSNDQSR